MTLRGNGAEAFTAVTAELVCVALLGYLFIGPFIFVPGHPIFAFSVIAVTTIGLSAVLRYRPTVEFYYLSLFILVILAVSWFSSHSIPLTLRGIARFGAIVGAVLAAWACLRIPAVRKARYSSIPVWLCVAIVFYLVMIVMDLYLFHFYPPEEMKRVGEYVFDAVRLGALLGGGIGVGLELGKALSAGSVSSPQR